MTLKLDSIFFNFTKPFNLNSFSHETEPQHIQYKFTNTNFDLKNLDNFQVHTKSIKRLNNIIQVQSNFNQQQYKQFSNYSYYDITAFFPIKHRDIKKNDIEYELILEKSHDYHENIEVSYHIIDYLKNPDKIIPLLDKIISMEHLDISNDALRASNSIKEAITKKDINSKYFLGF